mgnify:CR=1 FL=1
MLIKVHEECQYIDRKIAEVLTKNNIEEISPKLLGIHSNNTFKFILTIGENNYTYNQSFNCLAGYMIIENFMGSALWKIDIKIKKYSSSYYTHKCYFEYWMNTDLIEVYAESSVGLLFNLMTEYKKKIKHRNSNFSIDDKSYIPYENLYNLSENFKINLFDYQRKSLNKMINIENGENILEIPQSISINFHDTSMFYDQVKGCIVKNETNSTINSRGGILADEMGLGKTITTLALISENKSTDNRIFIDEKIKSKATLLIVPSHLAKQWQREAIKACPNFKIVFIATKTNHGKVKFEDIKNSDIVIVTQQFLMNFKYYPRLNYNDWVTASSFDFNHRDNHLKLELQKKRNQIYDYTEEEREDNNCFYKTGTDEQKEWDDFKNDTRPILEMFDYHRICIDEGHEIFGEMLSNGSVAHYISNWIKKVKGNFFWFISGTPFVNMTGIINCFDFLKLKLTTDLNQKIYYNRHNVGIHDYMRSSELIDNILSKICIRHKKDDVNNQIQIPGYDEELVWVELTDLERKLYNSRKDNTSSSILQQMCCHPLVAESYRNVIGNATVSLDEMKDQLISHHEKKIVYYQSRLEALNPNSTEYHMLKSTYTSKLTESKYILKVLTNIINEEVKVDEEKDCVICFDTISNPALTKCGHLFCKDCLDMCLQHKTRCPICKNDLKGSEIILVNKKKESKEIGDTNPLIKKYGSKLGRIISMVRTLVSRDDTRIIIFSQWDRMLSLIGRSLAENGIENSFVKGNIWSRNSAISKFKMGVDKSGNDNKVIMLSLKNAASGTNLTEATHIFFVEPINASKLESKSIEGQAIGRACRLGQKNKIKLIRVLTKNTIEQKIYEEIYLNEKTEYVNNLNNSEIII